MIGKIPFGSTGHESTRAIFGAAALGNVTQAETDRAMETLLEFGVNHIDTAASYGNSELRLGPWMETHRDQFFLATKTGQRTYEGAKAEIRRSLERLRVEQVDLIQLHCLIEPQEWETTMGPGGALEALIEAREAGLVRFIGVTGHGLNVARMHLRSLERFAFDSVLLPYNFPLIQNSQYAEEFETLFVECEKRGIAVQTIKAVCRRPWGDQERTAATWYQPVDDQEGIDKAAHWVLGHQGVFLNTLGDVDVLPRVLDAIARFEVPPSDAEMEQLVRSHEMAPLFV